MSYLLNYSGCLECENQKYLFCYKCNKCSKHDCLCFTVPHFKNKIKYFDCDNNKYNKSKRYLGVEIEVSNVMPKHSKDIQLLTKTIKKWNGCVVGDGSIYNYNGFEITTAPASGDMFVNQISEICDVLNNINAQTDNTCGLHVHIDARDFDIFDIKRLSKIYAKIENYLFSMVHPDRKYKHYCAKCGPSLKDITKNIHSFADLKEKINYNLYEQPVFIARKRKYERARYNALNLHSWFYRGTIECRMFQGTVDKNKIIHWGMLWANLLDFVLRSSDNSVDKLIKSGTPKQILFKIINNKNIEKFIEDCRKNRNQ